MALDKNAGKKGLGPTKWWERLIPGWNTFRLFYDFGQGVKAISDAKAQSSTNSAIDAENFTDTYNNHNIAETPDVNGYSQVEITPSDPTSSASNVISYDPSKSSQENLLGYAQANNSASAYQQFLANQYNSEMANSAIGRAVADAEANGISKYQLFQSGNAAASTPSSGSSLATSYENAMNRRESWNEKEMSAITSMITKIVTTTISSALSILGK